MRFGDSVVSFTNTGLLLQYIRRVVDYLKGEAGVKTILWKQMKPFFRLFDIILPTILFLRGGQCFQVCMVRTGVEK